MKSTTLALSALGLLALSSPATAATASAADPIAYACYYCSYPEMESVALGKGPGEHYVYDQAAKSIAGFTVVQAGATLSATGFTPPTWVRTQFNAMLAVYDAPTGAFVHVLKNVSLLAPGTTHTRSTTYLWGHHTSALNPVHVEAREIARRHVEQRLTLPYLTADVEHGRLLRFQSPDANIVPIVARLQMSALYTGHVDFLYDRDTGTWSYLQAWDVREPIQESAQDFAGPLGRRTYFYSKFHGRMSDFFVERAAWAGVRINGSTPPYNDVGIVCTDQVGDKSCTLTWN